LRLIENVGYCSLFQHRCGFSSQLVEQLSEHAVGYSLSNTHTHTHTHTAQHLSDWKRTGTHHMSPRL